MKATGITPAWAGKSSREIPKSKWKRDHPRVGGEKRVRWPQMSAPSGSPPRGRGKAGNDLGCLHDVGITPAWAGKREDGTDKENQT